ncbi:energy transducer TonB [Chryseobacterium sp. MIQD13]|uniref:energy transducer TonB n=1 Tax=Chryseobacterium sp. MIQD13 TaxID=3422310 RepID=UPI003D2CCF7A
MKNYYNQHRNMLNTEFKKKFDAEPDSFKKANIKLDFILFMKKMDSIENVAMIGALLKVRNLEDLQFLKTPKGISKNNPEKAVVFEKSADYPGGFNTLREEVAHLFYTGGVYTETKTVKTNVTFIVEKDGSISNVHAQGDNFTFNRQAEIALYSVSEKFSPAIFKGDPVRYHLRLPLTLTIED